MVTVARCWHLSSPNLKEMIRFQKDMFHMSLQPEGGYMYNITTYFGVILPFK